MPEEINTEHIELQLELPDLAMLDISGVSAIVRAQPATIRGWVRRKKFPPPVRLSSRCARWPVGVIKQWLQDRLNEAQQDHAAAKRASDAAMAKRRELQEAAQ